VDRSARSPVSFNVEIPHSDWSQHALPYYGAMPAQFAYTYWKRYRRPPLRGPSAGSNQARRGSINRIGKDIYETQ